MKHIKIEKKEKSKGEKWETFKTLVWQKLNAISNIVYGEDSGHGNVGHKQQRTRIKNHFDTMCEMMINK